MTDAPDQPQDPDTLWHYWYSVKESARGGRWEELRGLLAAAPDKPLSPHPFVTEVFHGAASAGETDIVRTLFARGFAMEAEQLSETIKRVALHRTETAAGVLGFLIGAVPDVDTKPAVNAAAAGGRLDALHQLEAAGADVLSGGGSFFVALYSGRPEVMRYLYEKGAALYAPALITAQYGRRHELPAERADAAIAAYHALVAADNEKAAVLYAASGGKPEGVAALREKVADDDGRLFTRLQLAVRAGRWEDIRAAALSDRGAALTAADFLSPDGRGQRAFDMLAARGELTRLFDAALWHHAPREAAKLHTALAGFRAEAVCDFESLTADMNHCTLAQLSPAGSGFRLQRRPKR